MNGRSSNDDAARPELTETAELLERMSAEEQATLVAAREPRAALAAASIEALMEREWEPAGARPRRSRRGLWLGPALIAAAVLAWLVLRVPTPVSDPVMLGGGAIEIVAPAERAADFGVVAWSGAGGTQARVTLRVLDPLAPEPLLELPGLTGGRIELDAATTDAWPDEIVIEVQALDAAGDMLDIARKRVTRRP